MQLRFHTQRFDQRVGKAENEQVLHGLLAEEVIDAIDLFLVEMLVQEPIQPLRRFKVLAEGFLDHHAVHATRLVEPDSFQVLDHRRELGRLDGKVEHRARTRRLRRQVGRQRMVGLDVVEIALLVAEAGEKAFEHRAFQRAVDASRQHFAHVLAPAVGIPVSTREGNDGKVFRQPCGRLQMEERGQ